MGKTLNSKRDSRLAISVAEAAKRIGIGRNSAYDLCRAGILPSIRLGGRVLVPVRRLEQFINGELPSQPAE